MKLLKNIYMVAAGAALLLAGCAAEMPDLQGGSLAEGAIGFSVSDTPSGTRSAFMPTSEAIPSEDGRDSLYLKTEVSDARLATLPTRGAQIGSLSELSEFRLMGRRTGPDGVKTVYDNEACVRTSGNVWEGESTQFWAGRDYSYRFFAYAPYPNTDSSRCLEVRESGGSYLLDFTVPGDYSAQPDLIVAAPEYEPGNPDFPGNFNAMVPLTFRHIGATLKIRQGNVGNGRIVSVELRGVRSSGTYDASADAWTLGEGTASFSASFPESTSAANTLLTPDGEGFIMLPQTLPEGAELSVLYQTEWGAQKRYTKALSGEWLQGKVYSYTLSVTPEFIFSVEDESELLQDAHYVKFKLIVSPPADYTTETWTISCDLNNALSRLDSRERVTFLSEADYYTLPMYANLRNGFWTDYILASASDTSGESARGEITISGSGSSPQTFWIFLPENAGDAPRDVVFRGSVNGVQVGQFTVSQLCPAWTSLGADQFGWEQKSDSNSGAFGFDWDYLVSYQIVYSSDNTFKKYYNIGRESYANQLIADNSAANFATAKEFRYKIFEWRYCITLDYSRLKDLRGGMDPGGVGSGSLTDGFANTGALYRIASPATTKAFETTIASIQKNAEDGAGDLFRKMTASDLYNGSVNDYGPKGNPVNGMDAVAQVLKKNRYNLLKSVQQSSGSLTTYTPVIDVEADLKWFLPARDQFDTASSVPIHQPVDLSGWSSTSIDTDSDHSQAYTGDGAAVSRSAVRPVRACRIRGN